MLNLKASQAEARDLELIADRAFQKHFFIQRSALMRSQPQIALRLLWLKYSIQNAFYKLTSSPPKQYIKHEAMVRRYLREYFSIRGIAHQYTTSPFPTKPEKPMLILTSRLHPANALFAYQRFDFPVLVPLEPLWYDYKILPSNSSSFIGEHLKHSSYSDISLNNAWPHLKKLLEQGYSVMAYINQGIHDPESREITSLYTTLKDIVASEKDLPADLYFLRLDGFERYPQASFVTPIQVRADLQSAHDTYGFLNLPTLDHKIERIVDFLAMWDYSWVHPKPSPTK